MTPHTPQDFRFTTKDDTIYAICLGRPSREVTIESCKALYPEEIKNVSMLGVEQPQECIYARRRAASGLDHG